MGAIQPFPPPLFLCFPLFAFLECREEFFLLLCVVRAKARRKGVRNSPTTFRTLQCSFTAYNITFGQIRPKTKSRNSHKKDFSTPSPFIPRGERKENSKEKLSPLVWTLFLKSGVGKVGCVFKNPIFWSVRLTVRSSSSKPPCRHPPPTPPQKRRVFGIQPIPLLSFLVGGDSFVHILSLLSPPLY